MSVPKINRYARIQGKTTFLLTAKLVIFGTDILCSFHLALNIFAPHILKMHIFALD